MLNIVGDVFLDRDINIDNLNIDGTILLNCEHAITEAHVNRQNKICLSTEKNRYVSVFSKCKIIAALANNHILDAGARGAQDTISSFREEKVEVLGLKESTSINVGDNGLEYFVYNYAFPDTNPIYDGMYLKNPTNYELVPNGESGFHIMYVHWGEEEISRPSSYQRTMARKFIDAGYDLVVGCHSHFPGDIERYKGKYIFYSLGNFFFPDLSIPYSDGSRKYTIKKHQRYKNRLGIIVHVEHEKVRYAYIMRSKRGDYSYVQTKGFMFPRFIDKIFANILWVKDNSWIIKRKLFRVMGLYE
jgi:hypothetical protein